MRPDSSMDFEIEALSNKQQGSVSGFDDRARRFVRTCFSLTVQPILYVYMYMYMCMCEYFYGKYADVCINTTNETKHELSRKSLNEKSKMREREREKEDSHRNLRRSAKLVSESSREREREREE